MRDPLWGSISFDSRSARITMMRPFDSPSSGRFTTVSATTLGSTRPPLALLLIAQLFKLALGPTRPILCGTT